MQEKEFVLTQEQQEHYNLVLDNKRNTFNSSCGGVGKSVLIHRLKRDLHRDTIFLSSTGISAIAIQGQTVHRGLSLPIGITTRENLKKVSQAVQKLFSTSTIKRIVIDEASMITPALMYGILQRVKRFNKRTSKRRERDIKLHFLCDLMQLPCVISENERPLTLSEYGTLKFYQMECFKELDLKLVEFTKVMRQQDKEMALHLSSIRTATPIKEVRGVKVYSQEVLAAIDYFNTRVVKTAPKDVPVIAPTNKAVATYNRIAFNANTNDIGCWASSFTGDFSAKETTFGEEVELKIGLGVMLLKNSAPESDILYSNGDRAVVVDMGEEGCTVKLDRTGEVVLIEEVELEKMAYELRPYRDEDIEDSVEEMVLTQYTTGTATGMPIKIGAAVSVHKSQGSSLDRALVDLGYSCTFTTGLLYVALSRLRSIGGLYLKRPITTKDISVDLDAIKWLEEMRSKV